MFFSPVRLYSGYWKTSHLLHEVHGRIGSMGAKTRKKCKKKVPLEGHTVNETVAFASL